MGYAPTKVGIEVECVVCKRVKVPRGRSVSPVTAPSYCDDDCPGYRQEPYMGDLWPGETDADFGFSCGNDGTRLLTQAEIEQRTADYFGELE